MNRQTPTIDEKKEALRRVLESRQFRRASQLRDFLQFVGSHALNGQTEEIHEGVIGRTVFQRRADYTPAEDSIVRVQARSLRKKLEAYFQSEGKTDSIVITIPKGAYIPTFEFRGAEPPALNRDRTNRSKAARISVVLALALLASLGGNLWLASSKHSGPAGSASRVSAPAATNPLWSTLFPPQGETYIIVADSLYTVVQNFAQRSFSLRDYQRSDFPSADAFAGVGEPASSIARQIFWHQYTSLTDTILAARLMQLPVVIQANTSIKFARNTHTRDFKARNVILLGSSLSNPWCELFEPQLNFKFEYDYTSGRPSYIRNKVPRDEEEVTYVPERGEDGSDKIYAVISFVRNLSNDGYVLMIAGTSMEGTEAAGELLLNPDTASNMIRNLGLESGGSLRPFEVLVKSSRMEGTSRGAVVVTHRVSDEP